MISTVTIARRISTVSAAVVAASLLTACDIDGGDNLPRVPDQGLFLYAEANRHEAEDTAQIVAAVFNDGEPVALVGGDVFEARTVTERILLKTGGAFAGSYAASIPVDNSVQGGVQDVFFDIVHLPIEAREDRWYPIDLLNIDPGPGELVGKSATVTFPRSVSITAPLPDAVYTSIDDDITLTWDITKPPPGDAMRVLSAIECNDGLATSSYGTEVEIGADDGSEVISMKKFIYDLTAGSSTIKFLSEAALGLLQETLNQLSAGNIDPDFLARQAGANPINSMCEIRLFLQRQLQGRFDVTFDDGTVFGSTSAEVTVLYLPAVTTN